MATVAASRGSPSLPTAQDAATSHPYTCNSCQVAFRNSDLQKGHMRGDWHRYNLKRRVASLPPISSEVFSEKVLQARAANTAEADKAGFQRPCDACDKTFFSENSYQQHLASHKHRANEAARNGRDASVVDEASSVVTSTFSLGEPVKADKEVDSDAEEEFTQVIEGLTKADLNNRASPVKRPSNPHLSAAAQYKSDHPLSATSTEQPSTEQPSSSATPTPSKSNAPTPTLKTCLFCNYDSPTVPLNATHMERIHGMFIPEKQYLADLEGLIASLQQRVYEFNECLYCGKIKANVFAVQTHMRDKSHCKIPYTTEDEQLEIGDFYDFRSTYSDDEESEDETEEEDGKQGGGAKLGGRRSTKITTGDGDEEMEEEVVGDGWETDSSASSLDSADLTAVPMEQHYHQYERLDKHRHHSQHDPRHHHQRDGWHSHAHKHNHAVFYDEYELHLPSGKSVGHRSLNRYYRQNLHNYPTPEERAEHQAIEAAQSDDEAMDVDGGENRQRQVLRREPRGRDGTAVSRRDGGLGMVGVSETKKKEVKRAEKRARRQEHAAQRRMQWAVNKEGNNQKYHTYEEL